MRPAGRYIVTLAILALVAAAAGAYVTRPQSVTAGVIRLPTAPKTLPPLQTRPGSYLGVTEAAEKQSYQAITTFAKTVRHRPNIVLTYSGWNDPFNVRLAAQAYLHGAMLLVQINPGKVPMRAVAAGTYDSYLKSLARQVHAFGYRVVLSFAAEMNGDWDPWGYRHTKPGQWIAAWRHVVNVFRSQHASNVVWLWTVNRHGYSTGPIRDWWPGRNYVTWVGIDGYYFLKTDTFRSCFAETIAAVRRLTSKPILLSEIGIGQVAGQARKIPGLFDGIKKDRLLGLAWYDVTQRGSPYKQNWRLEGHSRAIAAFLRGLQLVGYRLPA